MTKSELKKPRTIQDVLDRLNGVKIHSGHYQADCPVVGHVTPIGHLSVKDGGDRALVTCHGRGHTYQEICATLGFESLSYSTNNNRPASGVKLKDHEAIELLRQIYGLNDDTVKYFGIRPDYRKQAWRYPVKGGTRFKKYTRRPPRKYWHTTGTPNQLYGKIPKGATEIWLANGEPAIWVGYQASVPVVCGLYGEGKLPDNAIQLLKGKGVQVINLPYDLDAPGRKSALDIFTILASEFSIKLRRLPEAIGEHGDICDLNNWCGRDKEVFRKTLAELPEVDGAALVEELPNPSGLPAIMVTDRQLRDITVEALTALYKINDPPRVFRRSGTLSRVRLDEKCIPFIETLTESAFRGLLTRACDFFETTPREGTRAVSPPLDVVRDCLALGDWEFPPLMGITEVPVVRPDSTIITSPGYDNTTNLVYLPSTGLTVPPISEIPAATEVKKAIDLTLEPLCDFPFESDASHANAVAALFTPILRPMIDGPVPLCIIDKPQAGTGASLLAEVIALITTGRPAAMMTSPRNEEEWRKVLTSLLLKGQTVATIDNIEGGLWAPSLAAAITSRTWEDRVLGGNRIVAIPNRVTWLATGNNVKLAGDLPRRCIWVRMDAKMARPWLRDKANFKHPNLIQWADENRGTILAAMLTVTRAWVNAGMPEAPSLTILGGFESYCRVVGGLLAFMGVGGFLDNLSEMYDQTDTETPQWEAFLEMWHETLDSRAITAAELDGLLKEKAELCAVLPDVISDTEIKNYSVRLGQKLAKRNGVRYPNGFTLAKAGEKKRAVTWQVVRFEKETSPRISFNSEVGEVTTTSSPYRNPEKEMDICTYEEGAGITSPNLTTDTKLGEVAQKTSQFIRTATTDPREIVLDMTIDRVFQIWRSNGAPVINLGPGENCFDLEKLLSHPDVPEKHLLAIRRWLDTVEARP